MNVNSGKHAVRTARTRGHLEKVARGLFEARGFAAVSAEELAAAAGVTRGALYHHYEGKEGLFAAIAEQAMRELHDAIRRKAAAAKDPWAALELGARAFLDESSRPKVRQLLFVDAPAVLGWQGWREMDARYGLGMVEQALKAAMGSASGGLATMAAHALVSTLIEAAMLIARSKDRAAARKDAEHVVGALLASLRG